MQLHLKDGIQKSGYHFEGFVELKELAEILKNYQFDEEVLKKAAVHKKMMELNRLSFTVTLRIEPESRYELEEDDVRFEFESCELRNGKSKAATVCQLSEDHLMGTVKMDVFLVTREKMEKLEQNQR